jgi:oligopeptide/dipeptide ABC transporter ATP-binding protein
MEKTALLVVKDLVKYFPVYTSGLLKKKVGDVHAVDHVSFTIKRKETLALVGESGCGKTTTAKLILNLEEPTSGEVYFENKNVYEIFKSGSRREILNLRRNMALVHQNPFTSLNPRLTVGGALAEPLQIHKHIPSEQWEERISELLKLVGLQESDAERFPHEFSGGQRQRICIARALALNPKFIIADEPVSSLDVSIRAQILNLLKSLQEKFGLTFLYISHDLASVRQISHQVAVMYLGEIMELADTDELFNNPINPYTKALISAAPVPDPESGRIKIILKGEVPSPINPPRGCRFNPRCEYASDKCRSEEPRLVQVSENHFVACHEASKIA